MHLYEASLKSTDPITGHTTFDRLFTMRARNAQQVTRRAETLGVIRDAQGELIVYRY